MNKTLIIIKREYLTRVRKKSFIVMTLLGPLIMAALMVVPLFVAGVGEKASEVHVIDESGGFKADFLDSVVNTNSLTFHYYHMDKKTFTKLKVPNVQCVLYLPARYLEQGPISANGPGRSLNSTARPEVYSKGRETVHIVKYSKQILANHWNSVALPNVKYSSKSEMLTIEEGAGVKYFVAYGAVVLIYFFIFLYGIQVMKGVIEEKTNRIVEVMISSVKPFQLMMGKVLGLAMLGLTQYLVWLGIGLLLSWVFGSNYNLELFTDQVLAQKLNSANPEIAANSFDWASMGDALQVINFPFVLTCFFIYFLGGYLIYSALFAAIGAASDADTDTQQFTFPVTFPLLFSFLMVQYVIGNPDSAFASWMSQIPFTSPIIMMSRVPFMEPSGTFLIELICSMSLLALGFVFVTWVASRVYRIGILMYGKKVGYRELIKWMFYKG